MRSQRNLVTRSAEAFKPPVFRPNRSALDRVANRLRRFLDLQAGSAWRDLAPELADVRGRVIDVGCGAQIYRDLLSPVVEYLGIDTTDARVRFGYSMPDTQYMARKATGVLLPPALAGIACIANLTMAGDWGDDCLGYTITARRPPADP